MRHGMHGRGFSRRSEHRKAMFENLCASLIKHEQIKTTLPKAKDLRPIVERLISMGRRGGLANRRRAVSRLHDEKLAEKLVTTSGRALQGPARRLNAQRHGRLPLRRQCRDGGP